jgi:hypothetical protein
MLTAMTATVMTGIVVGACTQQSAGGPAPEALYAPTSPSQLALAANGANTELLCHARGNGTFVPLRVNANAIAGHLGHGDGRPLGEVPGSLSVFTGSCELVARVAGTWLGESITFDPNFGCGRDRNEYRLSLEQSGSDVTGEVYWKILESFFPPDVGMEQTVGLTSGSVSGNTFTFSYGPVVGTATFTDTTMTGTLAFPGPACDPNTFTLVRQ